jgi:hypothetical protein
MNEMLEPSEQLFFKLCSDHLAIEAIPRRQVHVDLSRFKDHFGDYAITLWTPSFVVLKGSSGEEITLRRNGNMIIRNTGSEEVARVTATKILTLAACD